MAIVKTASHLIDVASLHTTRRRRVVRVQSAKRFKGSTPDMCHSHDGAYRHSAGFQFFCKGTAWSQLRGGAYPAAPAKRNRRGNLNCSRHLDGVPSPSTSVDGTPSSKTRTCRSVRAIVEGAMTTRFVVSAEIMSGLALERGVDAEALLPEFVSEVQKLARPPTSQFRVGAAALGASGAVFLGVNVEFQGLPLNDSIHAEQFAVVTALCAGETSLTAVATTATPCGHCRQFMNELRDASSLRVLIPNVRAGNKVISSTHLALADLLPRSFGPLDLTHDASLPLLLEPRCNHVKLLPGVAQVISTLLSSEYGSERSDEMLSAALREAELAYAPYSSSPAGLSLLTSSGEIFSGRAVESAAYNPTRSPLHSALISAVGSDGLKSCDEFGGDGWSDIIAAVLIEDPKAPVQYEGLVKLMLGVIAPGARLHVARATTM